MADVMRAKVGAVLLAALANTDAHQIVARKPLRFPTIARKAHDPHCEYGSRGSYSLSSQGTGPTRHGATTMTTAYEIRTLSDTTDTSVAVSVLYAEHLDSDTAPSWGDADDAAVAAYLAAELGGTWTRPGEWDAGDHPTRLEAIATWERTDAPQEPTTMIIDLSRLVRLAATGHAPDVATARAALAAGRLYDVDTQGAGADCALDADDADAALQEAALHCGLFEVPAGWTATRLTAIVEGA